MSHETFWWLSWVLVALVVIGWYLSYTAARLDRLHVRLNGTLAALDGQLVRRAESSLELANSGLLDAASSLLLAGAASEALDSCEPGESVDEEAQTDLTQALSLAVTDESVAAMQAADQGAEIYVGRLGAACTRVELARRFHNDAVTDVRRVRRKFVVRTFHLAGHTPLPRTVEFDDSLPPPLRRKP